MKKLVIVLIALVIFSTGCKEESTPQFYEAYVGSILSVNDNGVFSEDIIYTEPDSTMTYLSDGTFESLWYDYEAAGADYNNGTTGEGWVLTGGERGSYSYDPVTFVLTTHITSYYEEVRDNDGNTVVDGGMEWIIPTGTNDNTSLVLMTKHIKSDIYKKSDNGSYVFKRTDQWTNENGELEWVWSASESITFSDTEVTIYQADYSEPRWSDNYTAPFMSYEHSQVGAVVSSNGDTVIGDGSYTTYHLRYTTDVRKWWDYDDATGTVSADGENDESADGNTDRVTYIGIEDCIFRLDSEWSRQTE